MQSARNYVSSLFEPAKRVPTRVNRFNCYEEFLELQYLLGLLKDREEKKLKPCADEALNTGVPTLGSVKYAIISRLMRTINEDLDRFNKKTCETFSAETRTTVELREMHTLVRLLQLSVSRVIEADHETLSGARDPNRAYGSFALKCGLYATATAAAAALSVAAIPVALAAAYYGNQKAQQVTELEKTEAKTLIILRNINLELDKLELDLSKKLKQAEDNLASIKP